MISLIFVALFLLLWLILYLTRPAFDRVLAHSANWVARFRYHDYVPVLVLLASGIAATVIAGDAFIDIAERVHANTPRLLQIDRDIHDWARETRTPGSTTFFVAMTMLGSPISLGAIVLGVTAILAMQRRWRWAAYLLFTCGVGALLNLELKAYFARARPELAEALRKAHGYSFPSGHSMGSAVTFGALAYLAFRVLTRWRWRSAAIALALTLICAIAISRVYIGVHWISDVGGGAAAGLIWVSVTTVAYETLRRIRLIRTLRAKQELKA